MHRPQYLAPVSSLLQFSCWDCQRYRLHRRASPSPLPPFALPAPLSNNHFPRNSLGFSRSRYSCCHHCLRSHQFQQMLVLFKSVMFLCLLLLSTVLQTVLLPSRCFCSKHCIRKLILNNVYVDCKEKVEKREQTLIHCAYSEFIK